MIVSNKIAVFLLESGIFSEGAAMHTNLPSVIKTHNESLSSFMRNTLENPALHRNWR